MPVLDLCRRHGLSWPTFYKWKATCGGLDVSEARRLKALEDEDGRLKRMESRSATRPPVAAQNWIEVVRFKTGPPPPARRGLRSNRESYYR